MAIKEYKTDNIHINFNIVDSDGSYGTSGQVLSRDAGGVTWADGSGSGIIGGPYLPLAGGTMTGDLKLNDNVVAKFGTGDDLRIQHASGGGGVGYIQNYTGDLQIQNRAVDKDILFRCDDGNGVTTSYLVLDGSTTHAYFSNPGNVGIGITSPSAKLHVKDLTNDVQLRIGDTNGVNLNPILRWSGDNSVGANSNADLQLDGENLTFNIFAPHTSAPNVKAISIIQGGNVGIGTTSPTSKLDVTNGAGKFCVDSKTHSLTNAFTTCLTVNLNSHTGCYVTLTCFGDWGSHSAAAYRGEFFLQNGANAYAEPGIILRQDDNTSNGTDQIVCQILDPTSGANPKDFEIQIRTTATTGTTSFGGQLTYTVQGKFNSIT